MRVFNRHVSMRGLTLFGFETLLVSGAVVGAAHVHGSLVDVMGTLWKVVLVTALCELCFYYSDLYDLNSVHAKGELIVRVLQGTGAAAIALAAVSMLLPSLWLGRGTFIMTLGVLVVAMPLWRVAFNGLASDPYLEERVLIVGTGSIALTVANQIRTQHDFAYRLVGFIEDPAGIGSGGASPILGAPADLPQIVERYGVGRIVVGLSDRRGQLPIDELLHAKLAGVRVEDAATTYERMTGKILVDDLKPSWFIFSDDGFQASRATRLVKRLFDLAGALIGIVAAGPIMLLTALAVRLDSPGPVLYCQERVGQNGRLFTLCKFRSMRIDAEQGTPVWASAHDDRVTRVGRFIRLTRLDELPQFWNVLRGEMSFVGPRPERPFFVQQLVESIPFYAARHAVKPGVTGWAQVRYRYGASVEDALEKLRYDLYYMKHLSLVFDLTILVDTIKVMVCRKGAQ
jgi:sugar transferase (PEP-CTERM system associated)